jgi:hypothetical protein
MWPKAYRDYKRDQPLIKYQVSSGHGIVGCEMHEINGWGNSWHGQIPQIQKLDQTPSDTPGTLNP